MLSRLALRCGAFFVVLGISCGVDFIPEEVEVLRKDDLAGPWSVMGEAGPEPVELYIGEQELLILRSPEGESGADAGDLSSYSVLAALPIRHLDTEFDDRFNCWFVPTEAPECCWPGEPPSDYPRYWYERDYALVDWSQAGEDDRALFEGLVHGELNRRVTTTVLRFCSPR